MATLSQIQNAGENVRNFFNASAVGVFPTAAGIGIAVSNRTMPAATCRALDRITKKYGCTYDVAPAVSKQQASFVVTITSAS